jgi:kynureninase
VTTGSDFPALFEPADSIYLLSHSVGRLPCTTRAAVEQSFFKPWHKGADEPWEEWLASIEEFRRALADLFNTDMNLLCPQTNLSSALASIMNSLPPVKGRQTILLSEDDFPSMGFVLQQAQASGYTLKYLPAGGDVSDVQFWIDQLEEGVGTAFITHVQSNSGRRAPIEALLPELRQRGIISIVDVAQSAGVIPIDLERWQADFVIGSCVKWLCGGPGAGYLWANPDVLERCKPKDIGWFSHENPFEFDIHNFRYHSSALKFWGGTPSVLPYVTASAGIRQLDGIGVEFVQRHNARLRKQIVDKIDGGALLSPQEDAASGATLVLNFGERQGQVVHAMLAAGIAFDVRPAGMRLSPHIYNTEEEIERLLACL